ncbi:hypothetical protein [Pseudopedobacter beijingensis]|uniref:Uncharacterized protein n=1 Tax=Pseudopedobacter beijingensis TaxID=1207056 RepID=A0ABW4IFT5_9SPHI
MKKLLVILSIAVYLTSTTEINQLLKLPILVEHYIDHSQQNPKMSFWDFLVLHYNNHEPDADYDTDMRLPFMAHHEVLSLLAYVDISLYQLNADHTVPQDKKNHTFYKELYLKSRYLSGIWQPPKVS